MRSSTQITAITESRETLEKPEFQEAQRFVSFVLPERLKDPNEARKIANLPFEGEYQQIGMVANFFETMGLFVKVGIIDQLIACDVWGYIVVRNWNALLPVTTYMRREISPAIWDNFEYLALLSERDTTAHPRGRYPKGAARMPEDPSLWDFVNANPSER